MNPASETEVVEPRIAGLEKKLAALANEIERVPKLGSNTHHNYKFVRAVDLLDHVRTKMVAHGLLLRPSLVSWAKEGQITTVEMDFTWIDTDTGEAATTRWAGAGLDTQEKGLYKAYTGAIKYFLLTTFMIPTGDDPEADAAKAPPAKQAKPSRGNGTTAGGTDAPAAASPLAKRAADELTAARKRFFGLLDKAVGLGVYEAAFSENTPEGQELRRQLRGKLLGIDVGNAILNLSQWKIVNDRMSETVKLAETHAT